MSEYVFSNEITTLAVNLEDGSWRVIGVDSRIGCKYFWYEETTGQLMTSSLGHVLLLEAPGEESDGNERIRYEVETPHQATPAGQVGTVTRVYFDINTRGEALRPSLVLDGGSRVERLPFVVQNYRRGVVEVPVNGVSTHLVGVRLEGELLHQVELFEVAVDVDVGQQEAQQK